MESLVAVENRPETTENIDDFRGFQARKQNLPLVGLEYAKIIDEVEKVFSSFGDSLVLLFADNEHKKEVKEIADRAAESVRAVGDNILSEYCLKSLGNMREEDSELQTRY